MTGTSVRLYDSRNDYNRASPKDIASANLVGYKTIGGGVRVVKSRDGVAGHLSWREWSQLAEAAG